MAIERPMGLDPFSQSPQQEDSIEVDIVNPESVSVDTPAIFDNDSRLACINLRLYTLLLNHIFSR